MVVRTSVGSDLTRLETVGLMGMILTVVCCLSWVLSPNRSLCSDVVCPSVVVGVVVVVEPGSRVVVVVSVTFF